MKYKNKLTMILLLVLAVMISAAGVFAIDVIPQDKQVTITLTRPLLNEDGTVCDDLAGYYLYRSSSPNGPFSRINNVLLIPSNTVYVDRHLLNNIPYYYRGTSVDDVGNESQPSPAKMAMPTGDEEKPAAITDLAISSKDGKVTLTWSFANDNDAIDHYEIYRDLTEIKDIYLAHKRTPAQINPLVTVDAETNTYTDSDVKAGTTYYYVVTAFDKSNNEADSSTSVSIKVPGVDLTPPYFTSLDEDSGGWPQKGGALVTFIIVGESGCEATIKIGNLADNLAATETAQPGTYIYTYTVPNGVNQADIEVSAKLSDGVNQTEKTGDTKITIDNTAPEAVADVSLTPLEIPWVKIGWTPGALDDAHHYAVYRFSQAITLNNKVQATLLEDDLPVDVTEYTDETARASSTYYYAVGVLYQAGNEVITSSGPITVGADTVPPEIILVTDDTMGATQKANNTIAVTIIGEPGLTASFSIEGLIEDQAMEEELIGLLPSGTYHGSYLVKPGDSAMDALLTGKLVDQANLVTTKEAAGRINVVTDSSDVTAPEITMISSDYSDVLVAGDTLEVTIEGEAGCVAYADLGSIKKAILFNEVTDGMYVGSYKVARGDNLKDANIVGYLVDSSGNQSVEYDNVPINIDTNLAIEVSRPGSILVADGKSTVNITATVKNARGEAINGEYIDFTLVGGDGELSGNTSGRTNSAGQITTTYRAGEIVITAFIAAEAIDTGDVGITYVLTKKSVSVDIALTDPNPKYKTSNNSGYSIEVFAKPHRITADGHSVSVITALVTKDGAPIEGVRVSFDIVRGVHGNEGAIKVRRSHTDANGEAEAVYTSATKTQLVLIQATAFVPEGDPVSENTQVLLIAGGVKYLALIAEPNQIPADGTSTSIITVTTEDEFNNLVPEVKVEFSLANHLGSLDEPYDYTSEPTYPIYVDEQPAVGGGEASVTFTAGTRAGTETVTATVTSQTWGGAGNFFQEGLDNFAAGDYAGTIDKFELALGAGAESNLGFTTDYTEENWTDDILFMRGYAYEMTDEYSSAISSYEEVVNYYFGGTWADNAQYRIALSYEKDNNLAQAIESYREVIDNFRSVNFDLRDLKDNAQFRLARSYEKSGYLVLARKAYQRLIDRYPNSSLVDDAKLAVERLTQP